MRGDDMTGMVCDGDHEFDNDHDGRKTMSI